MCGIVGLWDRSRSANQSLIYFRNMVGALDHRGPDDHGIHIEHSASLFLGHTRLAIQDLTAGGKQPMRSRDGRYLIVFNGEIYNHFQLRKKFSNFIWRGTSDTETLLECISTFGVDRSLELCRGMFAFAVFDRQKRQLILARDRFGEKPMYYGFLDALSRSFFFGSDVSALKVHPNFQKEISEESVKAFLEYGYVPAPLSIFKGICKLLPGSLVCVDLGEDDCVLGVQQQWIKQCENVSQEPCQLSDVKLLTHVESLLVDAVRRQSIADVPLGTFLSGGVDSSLITAIYARDHSSKTEAFTVGFKDAKNDESSMATGIAKHLGIQHSIIPFEDYDLITLADHMVEVYAEPFADSSQLPTYIVSSVARQSVTVALTGDGGDEIFCGYNRYLFGPRICKYSRFIPSTVASLGLMGLEKPLVRQLVAVLSRYTAIPDELEKIRKILRVLGSRDLADAYDRLTSLHPCVLERPCKTSDIDSRKYNKKMIAGSTDLRSMMNWDIDSYLPDDILCKVDRASMASGLETRAPYLDADLASFMATLPDHYLIRSDSSKWILRQLLEKYMPSRLFEQPKKGFGVQIDNLLRDQLRCWGSSLLTSSSLRSLGFLDLDLIQDLWRRHQNGESHGHRIWSILILSKWLQKNDFN